MIFAGLVKSIHVELTNKTIHLSMAKELGEDNLFKLVDILDNKVPAGGAPVDNLGMFVRLCKRKDTLRMSKVLATNPAISKSLK